MKNNTNIITAFSIGPNNVEAPSGLDNPESGRSITPKKRNRLSKLQPKSKLILELHFKGFSCQFICNHLKKKSIVCHISTINRFIHNSVDL